MDKQVIIINGRPTPYVRTTQKQQYVDKNYRRYRDFKYYVQLIAGNRTGFQFGDKLLKVRVEVHLYGKGKNEMGNDGDIDNYIKAALDSLNGIAFDDDRQVIEVSGIKLKALTPGSERMVIEVSEHKDGD